MTDRKTILTTKILINDLCEYFKKYRLIYAGILLCNFCCITFHNLFNDKKDSQGIFVVLLSLYFLLSFVTPIILGLIFAAKCFVSKTRKELLSNIIHSYIGTILIFAALFYQCAVLGDFEDSIHKRNMYAMQVTTKKNDCAGLTFMRIIDQRAFKGIKPRIWSGYDYPSPSLLNGPEINPDEWHYFMKNDYEDLSIEQIERIANNVSYYTKEIEYQKQNVADVYIDCLYFSVICIATVGFGDISPNLWYTKLFTAMEVFIGISIFVFAIGMLFSDWRKFSKVE